MQFPWILTEKIPMCLTYTIPMDIYSDNFHGYLEMFPWVIRDNFHGIYRENLHLSYIYNFHGYLQ